MKLFVRSFITMAVFCFMFLSGCGEPDPIIVYKLTLSENSVVFSMDGGSRTISVYPFPEDELWNVSCTEGQDWFTFEVNGSQLVVEAEPNSSASSRFGNLRLTSPDSKFEPRDVPVCQEAAEDVTLSVSANDYAFDSVGGSYKFTVDSNYDWTAVADADWLDVEIIGDVVEVTASSNESDAALSGTVTVTAGNGALAESATVAFSQGTHAENPYFNLLGKWEITAAKWYYSPNGSLNSLDYNPNPADYYLIFDLEEGEYGKSFVMRDFLYPDTHLEVRYDRETGNIVIPFGWTVYSYYTFLYITLVGNSSFSYASLEVDGVPSEDFSTISLQMPEVDGFNYVGFGLWTYDDNGNKVALGSRSRPTMFPMGPIVFKKSSL